MGNAITRLPSSFRTIISFLFGVVDDITRLREVVIWHEVLARSEVAILYARHLGRQLRIALLYVDREEFCFRIGVI